MKRLAVITTGEVEEIRTGAIDSLFAPVFITNGEALADVDGRPVTFEALLSTPCVALVGWSDADSERLETIQQRLIAAKAAITPDIVILDERPSWEALMVGVAHCVERFILLQAKLIGQQTRDLLALRKAHDGLQESFSALERYLGERAAPMLDEAFSCEPGQPLPIGDLRPTERSAGARQYLPVSTKSMGAFALHVAEPDPNASGDLCAEILVPETGRTIAAWRIPIAHLQRGWVTFGLERTAGGLPKSAHLLLRCEGDAGSARLSLGPINPLPLYQLATSTGRPITARSLALKVFVALPGILLNHDELTLLPDHMLSGPRSPPRPLGRLAVAPSHLKTPKLVLPRGADQSDFDLVRFIADEVAVLVHPGRDEPTVALFENCVPAGTRRLTGDILVDNPAAPTVGFRLGIVASMPAERIPMEMMGDADRASSLRISDWTFIGPDRRQTISLSFDPPVGPEGASLVLATRTPDGVSPDYAWAKFKRLHIETV
jgi:hypothetical protein